MRGLWPLGLVLEVSKGRDGLVRSCRVRVNASVKVDFEAVFVRAARPVNISCI